MKKLFKKIFLNQKTILEKKINQKILKLSKNDKTIKILIIRFSSFGDVVLSTIFLEALINKYKNYSIDVFLLTKDKYKSVFENNPNIKKIFVFDKNIINTYKNIKNEISPDFIFDLSVNLKSFFIAFLFKTQTFRISKNVFYRRFLVYFKFLIEYIKINNISIKEKYSNFFN
jgi:ADP-heptose:LPS heptosyltransferase